jgi:hypothetical protein
VVEGSLSFVLAGAGRSRAHPSSILGSVCAIVADGTPMLFTAGPVEAAALAQRLLLKLYSRAMRELAMATAAWLDGGETAARRRAA